MHSRTSPLAPKIQEIPVMAFAGTGDEMADAGTAGVEMALIAGNVLVCLKASAVISEGSS